MVVVLRTSRSTFSLRPISTGRTYSSRAFGDRTVFNDEDYRYVPEGYFNWYEDYEQISEPFFISEDYGGLT